MPVPGNLRYPSMPTSTLALTLHPSTYNLQPTTYTPTQMPLPGNPRYPSTLTLALALALALTLVLALILALALTLPQP